MSTKSRQVIWGDRIMGADIHAKAAHDAARKAARKADRAEAEAWFERLRPARFWAKPTRAGLDWLAAAR
jgi:hypothetical protein